VTSGLNRFFSNVVFAKVFAQQVTEIVMVICTHTDRWFVNCNMEYSDIQCCYLSS